MNVEDTISAGRRCPAFCTGEHRESWPIHARDVATLINELSEAREQVTVEVQQYGNREPHILITLTSADDDVLTEIAPATVRAFVDVMRAIGVGGMFVDALAEACEQLDNALDRSGVVIAEDHPDGCPSCRVDECEQCPTPRGTRPTGNGHELRVCCCGRRFVESEPKS